MPDGEEVPRQETTEEEQREGMEPAGVPVGGSTLRNTAKMIEKITIVDSGLISDQVQPSTDRLYFPRSSRSVRLSVSSRACAYSWSLLIGGPRSRGLSIREGDRVDDH